MIINHRANNQLEWTLKNSSFTSVFMPLNWSVRMLRLILMSLFLYGCGSDTTGNRAEYPSQPPFESSKAYNNFVFSISTHEAQELWEQNKIKALPDLILSFIKPISYHKGSRSFHGDGFEYAILEFDTTNFNTFVQNFSDHLNGPIPDYKTSSNPSWLINQYAELSLKNDYPQKFEQVDHFLKSTSIIYAITYLKYQTNNRIAANVCFIIANQEKRTVCFIRGDT